MVTVRVNVYSCKTEPLDFNTQVLTGGPKHRLDPKLESK